MPRTGNFESRTKSFHRAVWAAFAAALALGQAGCVAEVATAAVSPTTPPVADTVAGQGAIPSVAVIGPEFDGPPIEPPAVEVASPAPGQTPEVAVTAGQEVQLSADLESAYVERGSDGRAYLVVSLTGMPAPGQLARPSMAVSLVVDRSGSMEGRKIEDARAAAMSFVQSMADGDVVSVYQYNGFVQQVAPPTAVGPTTRGLLAAAVESIQVEWAGTSVEAGLVAGIESLSTAQAERPVRRVVIISDGQANMGMQTPRELGDVAASAAARGISVTSIGIGLDYDEAIMGALAVRSGGRFYHLQETAQLGAILQAELESLGATVARGVTIELAPSPGVQVLGATGADMTRDGDVVRLAVGPMLGDQTRRIVLPIRVPTAGSEEQTAGRVVLRYQPAEGNETREQEARPAFRLAGTAREVTAGLRPELAVAVEQHRAVEARREAARLVTSGEAERAATVLADQASASRRRARAIGGTSGDAISAGADSMDTRAGRVRAAARPSAPAAARRVESLELMDEALSDEGY